MCGQSRCPQTTGLWSLDLVTKPFDCGISHREKILLTIFVGSDQEWVAWTPEGYYTSSLNGDKYIGWHVNKGVDQAAEFFPAPQFQKQFYRPDVIAAYLDTRDIKTAVKQASMKRGTQIAKEPMVEKPNIQDFSPT